MEKNDLSKYIWKGRNGIILSIGAPKLCFSHDFQPKAKSIRGKIFNIVGAYSR